MPLSPEEITNWVRNNGYNPDDYDADPYSGEIKPRVKTQPALTPNTKPSALATTARSLALGVVPSLAAVPAGVEAGGAVGAALLPVMGPYAAIPAAVAGIGAGALAGAGVSGVQNFLLGKTTAGQEFLQKAAEGEEEHPVAAAVGNILSTAPTMRPNLQMLRDAGHALTTESAAGAGLLNKLATSQAAQQVALGAGLGGGMSVGEDLMAGRDVNWGKAAVNTVGQGLMSDVHGGVIKRLAPHAYAGQPLGVLNESQLRGVNRKVSTARPVAPEVEAAHKQALDNLALERQQLDALHTQADADAIKVDEATNELKKQAYAAKIKVLEKKKAALEAEFAKANPPAVDVVTEASPELREWTTAKAAQKGVPEVEFNDTGLLTDKPYGQFTPDKIEASTFAKLKRAGAEEAVTTLPEFDTEQATLFAGSKDQPSGAASTLIHEPIHAEIYNIVNSEKSGQTRIGEQLQAAVERDPRFKAWQAKEGKPWDEYLTRSTTRDILSDPMHKKRSWAEERKSLARLADGTATADDAVRIAGMKFRYDSNLAAPRAALKAAASMPAKSLTRVYEHELAKRDAQQPMEQMEFPKTAQQGTPLSKWQRDNTELPKGTFEPKLGQQDLRLSEPAASESAAPMSFEERKRAFAEDPANRKLVQSIPSEDKFDMNNWSRSGIAKFFGGDVSQQNIGQHIKKGTALAAKAGLKFDANEYFRDYNPRNKFATDAETGEKTPVALSKHTPFDKVEEEFKRVYDSARTDTPVSHPEFSPAVEKYHTENADNEFKSATDAFTSHIENEVYKAFMSQMPSAQRAKILASDGTQGEGIRDSVPFKDFLSKATYDLAAGGVRPEGLHNTIRKYVDKNRKVVVEKALQIQDAMEKIRAEHAPARGVKNEPQLDEGLHEGDDVKIEEEHGGEHEGAVYDKNEGAVGEEKEKPENQNRIRLSDKLYPSEARMLNRSVADAIEKASEDMEGKSGDELASVMEKHEPILKGLLKDDPYRATQIVYALRNHPDNVDLIVNQLRRGELRLSEPARTESPALPSPKEEDKRLFVTQLEKEFRTERPFGLQATRAGDYVTSEVRAKLKTLPAIEQDLLEKAGFSDWLSVQPRVTKERMVSWLRERGPKLEAHTYGMEGKVSEAKKEYDKMTHEWYETLPRDKQGEYINEADYIFGAGDVKQALMKKGWSEENATKGARYKDLSEVVRKEPRDTSPRATSYYNTVSAFLAKAAEHVKGAYTHLADMFRANPRIMEIPLENEYLGKKPEDYVIQQPNGKYMVNPNPHVGPMDSIHPGKLYGTREEALQAAKNLHTNLQILGKLEEHGIRPKWTKSTQEALKNGTELPSNGQRVDVVIPTEGSGSKIVNRRDNAGQYSGYEPLWQPDNLHENLPNTLGWAMIQYKTGPKELAGMEWQNADKRVIVTKRLPSDTDSTLPYRVTEIWKKSGNPKGHGYAETLADVKEHLGEIDNSGEWKLVKDTEPKKIAMIVEAQSRWGQEARKYKTGEVANVTADEQTRMANKIDHPLLRDYNRLILKAAIEQARKEGATHIVVSDAETAMMTEGHDINASWLEVVDAQHNHYVEGIHEVPELKGKEVDIAYTGRKTLTGRVRVVEAGNDIPQLRYLSDTSPVVETTDGKWHLSTNAGTDSIVSKGVPIKPKGKWKITQEPGMRLNYDPSVQIVDKEGNLLTDQRFPTEDDAHAYAQSRQGLGLKKPSTYPKDWKGVREEMPYQLVRGQLHQIAEELTGSKGEKMSLGEHKNAIEKANTPSLEEEIEVNDLFNEYQKVTENAPVVKAFESINDLNVARQQASAMSTEVDFYDARIQKYEGKTRAVIVRISDQAQNLLDRIESIQRTAGRSHATYRSNLIFRNPDGTPKTDVSGMMYPITDTSFATRRESGEPLSMAGRKYSEPAASESPALPDKQDTSKQGVLETFAPQIDQVRKYSTRAADALRNADAKREEYEGKYLWSKVQDFHREFPDATLEDRKAAIDYARAKFRDLPVPDVTPEQERMAEFWNSKMAIPMRVEQRDLGMKVETASGRIRKAGLSDWYAPDMLSPEAVDLFTNSTKLGEVKAAKDTWARHIVDASKDSPTPVTFDEALADINNFVDALGRGTSSASEFGALRKAKGFGLPDSLRDRDLFRVMQRYARRYARDMANFEFLEKDPHVGALLGMDDPNTGIPYPEPKTGRIVNHKEVTDALKFVRNSFDSAHNPKIVSASRLVGNMLMGPLTGIRDAVTIPANALPYVDSVSGAVDIFRSLWRARDEVRSSLESGARTGAHRFDQFDTIEGVDRTANTFNKAAEFLRKYQGRDIIEQGNRIWTFAIGKTLAERAIAENNTKFLDKFGAIAKTVAEDGTVTWDTNKLAKAFVDRNQGTYGGRGLPASSVDGMAAPWFSLARWSIEKSNVIFQDVIKPAYIPDKDGNRNFGPLLTYSLGAFLTGAAIEQLNEAINNDKKMSIPKMNELQAANASWDRYVARLVNVMQLGSFAGITGDAMKIASDITQGDTPRGFSVPTADLVANGIAGSMLNFSRAVRDGTDPIDAAGILLREFMKHQVQGIHLASNWADNEDVQRKNKFRDLRVWKQVTGREVPSNFEETNMALRPEERQLKRATTPEEVEALLPNIVNEMMERYKDDPYKLHKAIERLKSNSYQTFPSPHSDKPDAAAYYDYLVQSVGKEEADARLEDYVRQSGLNRGKARALGAKK